ncbi:hypothetical protein KYC5002_16605 [Archangium violaceum]|uniref:hypothetical protein n=1 Tax=Archangium violaceum TaxID=83451 RepID=UPI002B2B7D70|nr:hypothetical protein KYC5002_16605 [Archangium gephyra]
MPSRARPNTSFYISPVKTSEHKGGLAFRATLVEGFSSRFTAHVIDPRSGRPKDITTSVKWESVSLPGSGGSFETEWKQQELHLKGLTKGNALLQATYRKRSLQIKIEILESDMLVYAPDGFVYQIPTEVWTGAAETNPKEHHPDKVVRYHPEKLPLSVRNMLENEVTLANVPSGITGPLPAVGSTEPSDNITCFLLNLNSIALSYSPKTPPPPLVPLVPPKEPPGPKPAAKTKSPPTRRKR